MSFCPATCNLCVKDNETEDDKRVRLDAWKTLCQSHWAGSAQYQYPETCAAATGNSNSSAQEDDYYNNYYGTPDSSDDSQDYGDNGSPSPPPTFSNEYQDYGDSVTPSSPPTSLDDSEDYGDYGASSATSSPPASGPSDGDYNYDYSDYDEDSGSDDYSDKSSEGEEKPYSQLERCAINSDSHIKCRKMECKTEEIRTIACNLQSSTYRTLCPAMCKLCRSDKRAYNPRNKQGTPYPTCPNGGVFSKERKPVCNLNRRCDNDFGMAGNIDFALALGIELHGETKRLELCRDKFGNTSKEGWYSVEESGCANPCVCKGSPWSDTLDAMCCPAKSLPPTPAPTVSPCENSKGFRTERYTDRDPSDKTGTCSWVAKDITRCGFRGADIDGKVVLAFEKCKKSCGMCQEDILPPDVCKDEIWESKGGRDCSWVAQNFKRCGVRGSPNYPGIAADYCKRSCAGCILPSTADAVGKKTDEKAFLCEDSLEWRHQSVANGDCKWVSQYLPRCNWKGAMPFGRAKEHCLKSCTKCGNDLLAMSVTTNMVVADVDSLVGGPCEDDVSFRLIDGVGNVLQLEDCDWVHDHPRACNWPGMASGIPIKTAKESCPKACSVCK